jgi:hypothetical protein
MSNEPFSVIVWCWHDQLTNAMCMRLTRVDTSEEVRLSEGAFLLHITTSEDPLVVRCLVRHLSSGRQAYIQGGANLPAFVKDCLLNGSAS